jgi:hypothetical protein
MRRRESPSFLLASGDSRKDAHFITWLRNPQWHRHIDKAFGDRNKKRPISKIGVYITLAHG